MALTKTPATETTIPAGQFEGMDDTVVADPPAQAATAPVSTTPPAASTAATTAVAARPSNAVTSGAFARGCRWDALQDVLGVDMLEDLGFGAFPRVTVDQGGFNRDKTNFLGERIEFQPESWNFVWLVTTGEKNNKEADKLIRTSYDGVNITDGGTVDEYLKQLKLDGYKSAETKKYVEMYGMLVARTEKGIRTEIPAEQRKLVQVSVSPQSVKTWAGFILSSRMRKGAGVEDGPVLVMDSNRKTLNGNTFGIIEWSATKPV